MELFRISLDTYANSLSTSRAANRWNVAGQSVLYAGSSRSLSSLELIVHRSAIKLGSNYRVMVISVADDDRLVKQIKIQELPADWRPMAAYSATQAIGSDWYTKQGSLLLKVPSAIIIQEYNYLINTTHPDFTTNNVQLARTEDYFWDDRLLI